MLPALVEEETGLVVTKEPEVVAGSNFTVPDFAMAEGFEGFLPFGAFSSFELSGFAGLYLYSMKSESLSQMATCCR